MSRIAKRQRVSLDDATTTTARPRPTAARNSDDVPATTRTRRPSSTSATRQRGSSVASSTAIQSDDLASTLESISEAIPTSSAAFTDDANLLPSATATSTSPRAMSSTTIIIIGCAGGVALLLAALLVYCCQRKRKNKGDSAGRVRLQDEPDTSFTSSKDNDDSRDYGFGDDGNEKMNEKGLSSFHNNMPLTPTSPVPLLMFSDASPTSTPSPGFSSTLAPIRPARTPETLDILPSTPSTPITPQGNPLYHKFNRTQQQTNQYQDVEDALNTSETSSSPPEYASQLGSSVKPPPAAEQVQPVKEEVITEQAKSKPKKDTIYGFAQAYGDSDDEEDSPDPSRFSQAVGLARTMSKQEPSVQGSRQAIIAPANSRSTIISQVARQQQKSTAPIALASPPRSKLQLHKVNSLEKNPAEERTDYFGPAAVADQGFPFPQPSPTPFDGPTPTSVSNSSLTSGSSSSYGPTPSTSANSISQLSPTSAEQPVSSAAAKTIGHAPAVTGYREMHGPILSVYSEMGHVESNSPIKHSFGALGPHDQQPSPTGSTHHIPTITEEFVETSSSPFGNVRHSLAVEKQKASPTPSENQAGFKIGQSLLAGSLESAPSSPEVRFNSRSTNPAINVTFPSSPPQAASSRSNQRRLNNNNNNEMVLGEDGTDENGFQPLSQMSVQARQANMDYRSPTMSIYNAYD